MENMSNIDVFENISPPETEIPNNKLTKKKGKFSLFFGENKYIIFAALISAALMIFAYMVYKFWPLGSNTILRMDLYHQYGPLFAELYERIVNFDSLLYSWCTGGGSSFTGNFLNYLSSPLGIIIMLIMGHENMPEAIAGMILVKNAIAAGSFAHFLKKSFNRNDISITGFGLLYAFCGWFMAYYWNIMWLDGMCILPIVILGIQYIIDGKKKPYIYCGALCLVMLTSYYMAYMICIIAVVYFIYHYFSKYEFGTINNKLDYELRRSEYNRLPFSAKAKLFYKNCLNSKFLTTGVNFAFYSILAFLLAAIALIPVYFVLKTSSATGNNFPDEFKQYFNFFDFIANHLAGAEPTIRSSGEDVLPNVYTGILPLILAPLYFFSKKVTFKEKIATSILFAFCYFSFNLNYLNFIWHGFHFPNDLPYRWSFAYSFFLLFFAYKAFNSIDEYKPKQIGLVSAAVIFMAVLAEKITSKNVDNNVVLQTIVFAAVYAMILIALTQPKFFKSAMMALLVCSIITEIIIVDTDNFLITQAKEYYTEQYEDFVEMSDYVDEIEGENTFYREELSDLLTRMDASWYYYNGVSIFSSMAYESVSKLQRKLGMYGNDVNSYTYFPQTAVYNAMWGIKYIYDNDKRIHNDILYTELNFNDKITLYRFNYNLPVAYSVSPSLKDMWITTDTNPFNVQSNFFKYAIGVDDIFDRITPVVADSTNLGDISESDLAAGSVAYNKTESGKYANLELTITPETSGNVYIYMSSSEIKSVTASIEAKTFNYDISTSYLLDLGHISTNEDAVLNIELPTEEANNGSFQLYCVVMDENDYIDCYEKIKDNGVFVVNSFDNGTHLGGYIDVAEDSMLFTSIPYDEGWKVKIDGQVLDKSKYHSVANSFLAFDISAGHHEIEFDYMPSGLILGAGITIITIILIALFLILKKKGIFGENSKIVNALTLANFTPFEYLEQETDEASDESLIEGDIDESTATDLIEDDVATVINEEDDIIIVVEDNDMSDNKNNDDNNENNEETVELESEKETEPLKTDESSNINASEDENE
jgi:uncharacterized membrane protein YfhO